MCNNCENIQELINELWVEYCPDWEYEKKRLEVERQKLSKQYREIEATPEVIELEAEQLKNAKQIGVLTDRNRDIKARIKQLNNNPELKAVGQRIADVVKLIDTGNHMTTRHTIKFDNESNIQFLPRQDYKQSVIEFQERVLEFMSNWATNTLDKGQHFYGAWEFIKDNVSLSERDYFDGVDPMDNFKYQIECLADLLKKL